MSVGGCRSCGSASTPSCTDRAPIVATSAGGAEGRLLFADTGERTIELPNGWRRTASGISGVYEDVSGHTDQIPPEFGVLLGGFGYRVACRCAPSSGLYVEGSVDRPVGDEPGAFVGWCDYLAPLDEILDATVLGVVWITGSDPAVVRTSGGSLSFTAFSTLDAGRVQPVRGDVVRAEFTPNVGGGRLSCYVESTLWGYTDGLGTTTFRYAGIIGADLGVGAQLYDEFTCGCL